MRTTFQSKRKSIDDSMLLSDMRSYFDQIPDHRATNVVHKLSDVLVSAFAIFKFKYPSLLQFEQQSRTEATNIKELFGLSKICSDAQMRRIIDALEPSYFQGLLQRQSDLLQSTGIARDYRWLDKYLLISLDGVHYFRSTKVHCENCQSWTIQNGEPVYQHSMLAAVMVHPLKKEVFPIGSEDIHRQDGSQKNDCELKAVARLQEQLAQKWADQSLLFIEDALYANSPHIEAILSRGWDFLITVKPASHPVLFEEYERRRAARTYEHRTFKEGKRQYRLRWINEVSFLRRNSPTVNFLHCEQISQGKHQYFSWISSIPITRTNVLFLMQAARARWKIENETFNTLKNQGYHFEHNYGHGYQHLSNNLAQLMLLAFYQDQLLQYCSKTFRAIWHAAKSKKRLWESYRAFLITTPLKSFKELNEKMIVLYQVWII